MKKSYIAILLVLILAACGGGDASLVESTLAALATEPVPVDTPPPVPAETLPPDTLVRLAADYPLVDGSTSALPLQRHIACHILDVPCRWYEPDEEEAWMFGFETSTRHYGPEMDNLEALDEIANQVMSIWHSGTHGAYVNLIEGGADLIIVAREPSDDEITLAKAHSVILDVRPVAWDAFVFLVHADNPLESISLEDIRRIYTGELTDWAELGTAGLGQETAIHPYQRNPNSGSQELMMGLVMGDLAMVDAPDMIMESMMGPINMLADDPLGIGYSVFFYADYIYPHPNVRLLAVEGVLPTSETIADGSYPLSTGVYVVVRQQGIQESEARLLRDWLLTPEGQDVVAGSGYVPFYSP